MGEETGGRPGPGQGWHYEEKPYRRQCVVCGHLDTSGAFHGAKRRFLCLDCMAEIQQAAPTVTREAQAAQGTL